MCAVILQSWRSHCSSPPGFETTAGGADEKNRDWEFVRGGGLVADGGPWREPGDAADAHAIAGTEWFTGRGRAGHAYAGACNDARNGDAQRRTGESAHADGLHRA